MKSFKQRTRMLHIAAAAVDAALFVIFALVAGSQLRRGADASFAPVLATLLICVALSVVCKLLAARGACRSIDYLVGILDTVPFMLHATDMDMNWTFLNKATAEFLQIDRDEVMGKHCSNWNAVICGTDKCSAYGLRNGRPVTYFQQNGMDIRVDTNWLLDGAGERIGYVECVQDISETVDEQNRQNRFVQQISQMCGSFVTASAEVSSGAQVLAQGSIQQAASVEELSASISNVAEVINRNVDKAETAAQLSATIQRDAETGSEHMHKMTQAVDEITEASESIGKVIKVIDDIAFQTNILALNAAVEAARAGQHGKGFAVVADEVRNLASKSAEAAKDTGVLIENSIEKAKFGARISNETASALGKIIEGISESSRIVEEIAQSSREQNEAIAQINLGIEQVSAVVQQNSATAEQSASASEEMNGQINELQRMFDAFNEERAHSAAVAVTETGMAV